MSDGARNPHWVLGTTPRSSDDEVKEAHRFWSLVLHADRLGAVPDRYRKRAEDIHKAVNIALEQLQKRGIWDAEFRPPSDSQVVWREVQDDLEFVATFWGTLLREGRFAASRQELRRRAEHQIHDALTRLFAQPAPGGPSTRSTEEHKAPPPRPPPASPSPESRGDAATDTFVASRRRGKFHRINCEWAEYVLWNDHHVFQTRAEALKAGLKPCGTCNP